MTPVRLLPEAEEGLRETARFYEAEQRGLGRALIQEVRRACRFIAERPLAARIERGEVESERSRGSRIASTTARRLTRSWSSPSVTADEDRDSGAAAGSHITSACRAADARRYARQGSSVLGR
jgi:plasmid stabilization system protein ParE